MAHSIFLSISILLLLTGCDSRKTDSSVYDRWPELQDLEEKLADEKPQYTIGEVEKRAREGDHDAIEILAKSYFRGGFVERNDAKAKYWVDLAKRTQLPLGYYFSASLLEMTSRKSETVNQEAIDKSWQEATKSLLKSKPTPDYLDALSHIYKSGKGGIEQDSKKAFSLAERAVKEGHARASARLGTYYESGIGIAPNPELAFTHYAVSAEKGDAAGNYHVGRCYLVGIGTSKDRDKALGCLARAASKGSTESFLALEQILDRGLDQITILAPKPISNIRKPETNKLKVGDQVVAIISPEASWYGKILEVTDSKCKVEITSLGKSKTLLNPSAKTGHLPISQDNIGEYRWIPSTELKLN